MATARQLDTAGSQIVSFRMVYFLRNTASMQYFYLWVFLSFENFNCEPGRICVNCGASNRNKFSKA